MKKIEFGKRCYDGLQNRLAWSGTLLCLSHKHIHHFLSDGTVCVRVSVCVGVRKVES